MRLSIKWFVTNPLVPMYLQNSFGPPDLPANHITVGDLIGTKL